LENGREPEDPDPPDPRRKALLALLFVVGLVAGGLLLTRVLSRMSQLQDCVIRAAPTARRLIPTPRAGGEHHGRRVPALSKLHP
jgi:hypothetical protein